MNVHSTTAVYLLIYDPNSLPSDSEKVAAQSHGLLDEDDDDDFAVNTSDEEDENEFDTSSVSSKGEPEPPEESTVRRADFRICSEILPQVILQDFFIFNKV